MPVPDPCEIRRSILTVEVIERSGIKRGKNSPPLAVAANSVMSPLLVNVAATGPDPRSIFPGR